jgi:hypothetical protein
LRARPDGNKRDENSRHFSRALLRCFALLLLVVAGQPAYETLRRRGEAEAFVKANDAVTLFLKEHGRSGRSNAK